MTPLAIVLTAAAALACASLLWPLRRGRSAPDAAQLELAVYRDQLAELERDAARGVVEPAQARAARIEIERRILKVAPGQEPVEPSGSRRLLAALAVALPVAAGGLYLTLGSPGLPSVPYASRPGQADDPVQLAELQVRLEARVREQPGDVEAWTLLGRVRGALGTPDQAVAAFQEALKLKPDDPGARLGMVESLTAASDGTVPPAALTLLEGLIADRVGGPRVAYYRGLAAAQAGNWEAALERWREALAQTPADAPWRDQIVAGIRDLARRAGQDPEKALADLPAASTGGGGAPGPSATDVAAAEAMSPDERQAMIRSMVDGLEQRLAANGDDVEGWLRLGRSRAVLGEPEKAAAAFAKAAALRPDDPEIAIAQGEMLLGPDHQPSGLPEVTDAAAAAFRRAAALAPDDARVNWYLGIRAVQDGDKVLARTYWTKLLKGLPANSPDRGPVEEMLGALGS